MSRWLSGIKDALEREIYAPTERYQVMVQIGNVWANAAVLTVKSEYDSEEQARQQAQALLELSQVNQAMIAKKTTVCFSDLETKQTTKATEWSCLLLV